MPKIARASAKTKLKKEKPKGAKQIYAVRGMKDILPKEDIYWRTFLKKAISHAEFFNFDFMLPPVIEEASLYMRSIGRGTDIVDKEMYVFEDRDASKIALRPEFTAGIARSYIQHGMHTLSQPVKVWTFGPLFRHERPQAGRFREHRQFNIEVLGSPLPIIDAEAILFAYTLLSDFGIPVEVRINSIGTPEDRTRYKLELVGYYKSKRGYLCDDCKKRLVKNPLRLLDCKKPQCQPIKEEAPQILDWLGDQSKTHFTKVLEFLDALNVPYVLDPTLVRGLDYYTHTLFEIYTTDSGQGSEHGTGLKPEENEAEEGIENESSLDSEGSENSEGPEQGRAAAKSEWPAVREETAQSALCGGGRYDLLIEQLGGPETPAFGFGMGVERVIAEIKARGIITKETEKSKVFLAQLGEQASGRALKIMNDLRKNGIKIAYNLGKTALKSQLEIANKTGVEFAIIIGQKEVNDGTVILRDMESGNQEIVDENKLEATLRKELSAKTEIKIMKKKI